MKESELKSCIGDYLQYGMNQGKWYYDRLNSGSVLVKRGEKVYRVELCREGTADFMVFMLDKYGDGVVKVAYRDGIFSTVCRIIFLELKGEKGKQRPEQGAFQKLVEMQGASYFIIRSLEDLEAIL